VSSGLDYATVAYNASTGASLWVRRYNGPGIGDDQAAAVTVSPDGSKVFVTGASPGSSTADDYATEALNASTGALLWVRRYNGPGNGLDQAAGLAISPDGTLVFVTGQSYGGSSAGTDFATIAYNVSTGAVVSVRRYDGPGADVDTPVSITAAPDGKELVVTGTSRASSSQAAFLTVAYNPATGAHLWTARDQATADGNNRAVAIASSPDSSKVFVAGTATTSTPSDEYLTVAYNASTGVRVWQRQGAASVSDDLEGLAVSPDGSKVFVTGGSSTLQLRRTIAYSAGTGSVIWNKGTAGYGTVGGEIAVSPNGNDLWVADTSDTSTAQMVLLEFLAGNGSLLASEGLADGEPYALAISPDSSTIFVTGQGPNKRGDDDYATVG
jgi:DNA-binding beta-propeller fold protein YncE